VCAGFWRFFDVDGCRSAARRSAAEAEISRFARSGSVIVAAVAAAVIAAMAALPPLSSTSCSSPSRPFSTDGVTMPNCMLAWN
jgi:hypothetical protein